MPALSKKLQIGVLIAFLLLIPAGVALYHYGPAMAEAWRFRKLGRPLDARGEVVGYIVASGSGVTRCELDPSGKVVRHRTTKSDCFGVDVLANGNLLLGARSQVEEIDSGGKVVWSLPEGTEISRAMDVSRLENGNTLVADSEGGRVVEFSPDGEKVWIYECEQPYSAQRLKGGETLIGAGLNEGRVFEVSREGEVVWERKGRRCPNSVRRLDNGNTLVAYYFEKKIVEFDREGREVWSHKCSAGRAGGYPVSAERLPDGRTLVSTTGEPGGVALVSPDGGEKILYEGPADGKACAVYEKR